MTRDEATEKLKKLLRLAKSDNAAEAALALAKAVELSNHYAIGLAEIDPDDTDSANAFIYSALGKRMKRETLDHHLAEQIILIAFPVNRVTTHFLGSKAHQWLGRPAAVDMAEWAFNFLLTSHARGKRAFHRAYQREWGRNPGRRELSRYSTGFFYGVARNLKTEQERKPLSTAALMVLDAEKDKRQAFFEATNDNIIKTRRKPRELPVPNAAGLRDGMQVKLTGRALDCAPDGKLLLTGGV